MRAERILFLDIDGVLNSVKFMKARHEAGERNVGHALDPTAVAQLQRVVDETGCEIVLSSTWRLIHSLSDMRGMLIAAGMRHPVPLIDKTPCLDRRHGSIEVNPGRGKEVQAWIDMRMFTGPFCCIDDDTDFMPHQNLVRTDHMEGMTAEHADRCIEILRARVGESA
jgi:hypothetical protein